MGFFVFNGRARRPRSTPGQAHDFIENTFGSTHLIIGDARPLYEQGHTLRDIAKRFGVSKNTVRKSLLLAGVDLRPDNRYLKKKTRPPGAPHIGGQLVEVPKEMEVIHLVLELWRKDTPYNAIAKHLNDHGFKPRRTKRWEHTTIISIVKRNKPDSS